MGDVKGLRYSKSYDLPQIQDSTYDLHSSTQGLSPDGSVPKTEVKPEEEEKYPQVGFLDLFRFSDRRDHIMHAFGLICSILHGACYVVILIIFGNQTDVFIDYSKAEAFMDARLNLTAYNLTKDMIWANRTLIDRPLGDYNRRMNTSIKADKLLPEFSEGGLLKQMTGFSLYYVLIGGIVLVAAYGQIAFFVIAAERTMRNIRFNFIKSVLRQDVSWYDRLGTGELNTRLSDDMTKIVDGTADKMGTALQMGAAVVIGFTQGFFFGWKLALVMLAVTPAITFASLLMSMVNATLTNNELKAYARAGKVAEEVIGSIRTVSAFGGEKKEVDRYERNLVFAKKKGIQKGLVLGLGMGAVWFIIYLVYALGFWYGAKLVIEESESYSAGKLLIVFFSVVTAAACAGQAGPNIQAISTARGACHAIYEIIDRTPPIDSASSGGSMPNIIGNIEFHNVIFRYPTRPDVPVLTGLNLEVKVGQTVALVGSSGCGKSTTVQLLQRFYDPLQGRVTIDGVDIRDINVQYLRRHIGIVSQEPVLFGCSIAENIRYGREGVTQAEIEDACRQSNIHTFISNLPDKYETPVGERGAQLSGGQKQRIAIARALVRNPKILLLDEATSALDTESEASVQAALDKASRGRTTMVIAHRLSTVKNADVICGFDGGVVVEQGNHEELMKMGGIYGSLVQLQTREMKAMEIDEDGEAYDDKMALEKLKEEQLAEQAANLTRSGSLRGSSKRMRVLGGASIAGAFKAQDDLIYVPEDDDMPSASLRRLVSMNAKEWWAILLGCLGALINGAEMPVYAVIFAEMVGIFTYLDLEKMRRESEEYAVMYVILGVIFAFSQFAQNYFFAVSGEGLTMRLRQFAFKAMMRQDIGWFDDHRNNVGALCTRLATDASNVQGATGSRLGVILQNISNIGVGLTIAFIVGWKLTLVMCAFVPVLAVAGAMEARILTGLAGKDKAQMEKAGKIALESFENIRTVAGLNMEQKFSDMYYHALQIPYNNAVKKSHVFGISFSVSQAAIYFCFAGAFMYGAQLINDREMDFNGVFMVFSAVIFCAVGIGNTVAFVPDFTKAKVAAAKLFKLFDRVPPIDVASPGGIQLADFSGQVEFKDIRFRYPSRPNVKVLQGLNIGVKPGKTLALVGSSGCGKSTSVQLIERFYDALSGNVLFDGTDIKSLNLQWVRNQIGIVSQEPLLFDCTIAENIQYGDNTREVTMEEVIQAAKSSNIHSFIHSLPLGYNTRVGDKGTQLSGGQKQRVAIARALVRKPKVLLLDEATSALDTESEQIVQEALDNAREGRTCIVIAHRLSTIQDSDAIAVIHLGRVVELGRHDELMELEGIYYNLQMTQKKGKKKQ